jgi:hypothetical protein
MGVLIEIRGNITISEDTMKIIGLVVTAAVVIGTCQIIGAPADAAQSCIRAGGEGSGLFQGFASFMAQAAMKNQAKGWGGDSVKIGEAKETCQQQGLMYSCTAFARACK